MGKPCFLSPWCNRGWDGQPDFALLNRQLREVGQPHLLRIIWRSGFCETFFANSHPSSSSRRKMSKFDLKDVRSLLGEQDWSLLLLQSLLILSLCFLLFLDLKRYDIGWDWIELHRGSEKKLQLEIKKKQQSGNFSQPTTCHYHPVRFDIIWKRPLLLIWIPIGTF